MAFLGMRGTGDWATDERPKNYREGILYLYPNGSAPLTAIMSKMRNEAVDDPEFNWWTKTLPTQTATITGVYTNVALSSAYASGGAAGDSLYIKMSEAHAGQFRIGHQVLLRDASHYDVDVNAKVTNVVYNGASSYIAVKLLEADDNGASTDLSDADTCIIVGNINSEGAPMPDAVAYDPTKVTNYTQIFRNSLSITRTARKTKLRTKQSYEEAKREALELHSIEMEKAFLFGIATENTGANGKPERTTGGVIAAAKANGTSSDFSLDTDYSGDTWIQSGEDWLDEQLEVMFRYGSKEKLAFVGSGALLGINRLIKNNGTYEFNSMTTSYGIKVVEWVTPFGSIYMKTHPLFSYTVTNRNSMVIFEPENIKYRYIDDTKFYKEGEMQNTGRSRTDSTEEEFLTEAGLEYHHPLSWGYLNGFNTDNSV
jgi:hypothetical protein